MLGSWQAMRTLATAAVVVLGMVLTSTFSWLMRASRPGPNPFDLATLALAMGAIGVLVAPFVQRRRAAGPPPTG